MVYSLHKRFNPISAAIILATLVACSQKNKVKPVAPKLHLACQTVECECRAEKQSTFSDPKLTEIVWKSNGHASCPRGHTLEKVKLDFLGRRQ